MDSMTNHEPLHVEPADFDVMNTLDMKVSSQMSLAVLVSAPPESALRIALEVAVGPEEEGAAGAVIVHARNTRDLQAALSRAAMPGIGRRAVVVQEIDALDFAQQSAFKAAMDEIARHGANACRIIATTSVPLFERVVEGLFDAGLFYRLNSVHIQTGSLPTEDASPARPGTVRWAHVGHERGQS